MKDIELYPGYLCEENAEALFTEFLENANWQNELRVIGTDKKKKIHRKMAYCADTPVVYQYAGLELDGQGWISPLLDMAGSLEFVLGHKFNSCLLNLYNDGRDEIRWHSDKEDQLGPTPTIACVNLGATRKFWFLEKATNTKTPWTVNNGDLLVMGPNCQQNYLHAILKEPEVKTPRMSLTFRWVYDQAG